MKIAFLVQAHTNVDQLVMLAKALKSGPQTEVVMHVDRRLEANLSPLRQHATLIDRIAVHHGGFSQVVVTLAMLRVAVALDCTHYLLLSGQCFPIKELAWLKARLEEDVDYISHFRLPIDRFEKRLDRFEHFHFEDWHVSKVSRVLNRLAKKLPKRNFVAGLSLWPYGGSNWWCLRKSTVDYVLRFVERYPNFSRFMRHVSYVDEVFFQSIISNMAIENELRPALFHAEFDAATGRPRVFGSADIGLLDSKDVFVARKFDLETSPSIVHHYFERLAHQGP